ncbi:transketolase C-terminal domain-containing protein [Cupriavidus basilensis]
MVHRALEAAATLAKEGIEAEIVDLRTLFAAGYRHRAGIGGKHRPPGGGG